MTQTVFVLVEPQLGENIGMAARVMRNFGFTELRIVNPRDGWPNPKAISSAADAFDSMKITVTPSLHKAVSDLHSLIATTARPRELKSVFSLETLLPHLQTTPQKRTGILFGPENSGLSNNNLALCQHALTLSVDSSFPSLNLAQAVAVIAHTLRSSPPPLTPISSHIPASKGDIHALFTSLSQALAPQHNLNTQSKHSRLQHIQRILTNASLSPSDVRLIHGIIRNLARKNT